MGKKLRVNMCKNFINPASSTERKMEKTKKNEDETSTLTFAAQQKVKEWK